MKRNLKQRLKHSLVITIIALMLRIVLTSCFDANEVDDMIYIVCVRVDRVLLTSGESHQYENMKESSPSVPRWRFQQFASSSDRTGTAR